MAQASSNPFLQSPYAQIGLDQPQAALPGQQAVDQVLPDAPAAPAPSVSVPPSASPSAAPRATPAATKPGDLLPPAELRPIFEASAREFNVPVNVLMALGQQESQYNASAIGQPTKYGRAKGMLQYLDDTAKKLGINPLDPGEAIPAAAKQLRERLDKGESMIDAVRGHFAGPDRAQWGPDTAAYGEEVLAKAGQIGDSLYGAPAPDTGAAPADAARAALQAQLDTEAPGRYRALTEVEAADLRAQQDKAVANQFSTALPREQYERMFRSMNKGATDAAIAQVMADYDKQAAARTQAGATKVEDRFATLRSPEAMFEQRLNAKLQAKSKGGVVPALPAAGTVAPKDLAIIDPGAADRETGFDAMANFLGKSTKAGLYDLAGAGARVLDEVAPFTLTPDEAATLYKDRPERLKELQDNSTIMVLSRFANRMAQNSDETMAQLSARAKRDYGNLEYATLDPEKAAYLSPTKVIGDTVRSLPSTLAMGLTVYLTRGAALQAERQALAAGLSQDMARQAAIQAGAKAMANVGAASEGAMGYGQQVNQVTQELAKMPQAELDKSPQYQTLLAANYTPETARAQLIADAAQQAGRLAGIADAAVNKVGGEFLGKILTEGGKLIPRIMKGAANEALTETTQSALEQLGQNFAVQQNVNPNQALGQGVGEAAAAGAVMGGLMGGGAAGAGGTANTPSAEQQVADAITQQAERQQSDPRLIDAAARAALDPNQGAVAPVETRLPAPPSQAPGLLTRALEDAAAPQQPRVTATLPDGQQAAGQLTGYQEDADGNFVAQILGDDGQVHTVDSASGIQIVPDVVPASPLSGALDAAAEQTAAEAPSAAQTAPQIIPETMPAPEAVAPAAPMAEPIAVPERAPSLPEQLAAMDLPALQERLQYIQDQAKRSGGMTRPMVDARNAVQREIQQRKQEAARAHVPTESTDERSAGAGMAAPAGLTESGQPSALQGVGQEPAPAAVAAGTEPGAGPVPAGASAAADAQPALTGYPTDLAARQARKDLGLGRSHQVIERAPGQFDIVPQAAKVAKAKLEPKQAPRRSADKLAAAEAKSAKQEAAIASAQANAAARAEAKISQPAVPTQGATDASTKESAAQKTSQARQAPAEADVLTGEKHAIEEKPQQGSVQPERARRGQGRATGEAGRGNRVQREARGAEEQAQPVAKQEPRRKKAMATKGGSLNIRDIKPGDQFQSVRYGRTMPTGGTIEKAGRTNIEFGGDYMGKPITGVKLPRAALVGGKILRDGVAYDVVAENAEPAFSVSGDDYRDDHVAPGREDGAPLSDLTGDGNIYPDDVYSKNGPRYYGTGNDSHDKNAFRIANMAKGNPDFDVMIYRAIPSGVDAGINPGDWVTIVRGYAEDHGESRFDGDYKIISKMVKASDIFTNGDSIQEWGYDPEDGSMSVTGDDTASTIQRLMADKAGEATVNVPGLGAVTIPYGDAKAGLAHIAKRRGADFLQRLPALLENGKVYTKGNQEGRVFLGNARDEAVISLTRDGKDSTWLLSAYERYPDLKEAKRSQVAEDRMPDGQYFTKDDLRANLSRQGVLGQVIASMIDAGVIVLHGGVNKLPGAARRVKSVQAVTMPDGTIHMVASNLTPATALPVLLHEMFHQGGEALIGSKEWGNLQGRLGSLYRQSEASTGKAREFFDRARARVEAAKKKGAVSRPMEVEEFAAYAIEEYEKDPRNLPGAIRKWVEDLIGLVKTWLVKNYGKQLGAVTPAQLSAMARWAIMDVAVARRGEMFGPLGEVFSASTDQTDTPAFKKWFGDSKVVDENGAPLVVYHGTDKDFSTFSKTEGEPKWFKDMQGFYFTRQPEYASDYGGTVMPVYLAMNKPYIAPHDQYEHTYITPARRAELEAQGYDGMIFEGNGKQDSEYIVFKPEQIKSAIGNNGDFDPVSQDIRYSVTADDLASLASEEAQAQGLTPAAQGKLRRFQSVIQDNMNRVKQVQERIGQITGDTELGRADYYGAETVRPGRIASRLDDFREGMFAPLIEQVAKDGYMPDQLAELLHAQHAEERNAAVARINPEHDPASDTYTGTQGSGMNDADAQRILAQYANEPKLLALANQARQIAKATLDLKLAYGLIKPADYELLTTQYQNYVPLKGDGEYGPKIKRATGHGERAEHILENIARDYEQATVAGEKNLARQSLLQLVLKYPDDQLWTARVPPRGKYVAGKSYSVQKNGKSEAVFGSLSQVNAFLEAKGAEAASYEVLDSAGERVVEFTKPLQDNEVIVYVNGDPVRLQFHDEALARQLRPLDGGQLNPILETMRKVNRYLSGIYTGYNPAFIFKNAVRDAITGTLNITANQGAGVAAKAWTNYPDALAAMGQWASTRQAPQRGMGRWLEEYRQHGGKTGASWMSDLEAQGKTIQATFDDARGLLSTAQSGSAKRAAGVAWRQSVGKLAHVIEIGNQAAENALRLALYATLREQGQSPAKAAQAAKTVTVDFDRKGSQTAALGALYLFLNPAIQGTANAVKALTKGQHRTQGWAALGGLAALGALAAAQGMDDDKDRWLGQSWEDRTKNLVLTIGGHQLKLPLSQEFAPFYAVGVAATEALRGEKPMTSAARLFSSFVDAYFPLKGAFNAESENRLADVAQAAVPTLVKPLVESGFNRNSFGYQIVPENPQTKDRADSQKMFRATKGTAYDTAAQTIAKLGEVAGQGKYENDWSKVSPETLKYLWRTYTGGLGAFITDSAGAARIAIADPNSLDTGDIPVLKDFVKEQNQKPLANRYRELAREAQAAITEYKQIKKAGDGEAADLFGENGHKLALAGMGKLIESVNKSAAALADRKVDINGDADLSLAEKRAALKAIEAEEAELYRGAIGAFTQ